MCQQILYKSTVYVELAQNVALQPKCSPLRKMRTFQAHRAVYFESRAQMQPCRADEMKSSEKIANFKLTMEDGIFWGMSAEKLALKFQAELWQHTYTRKATLEYQGELGPCTHGYAYSAKGHVPTTLSKDHVSYNIVEGSRFLWHCRRITVPTTLSKDHTSYDIVEGSRFLRHCRRITFPATL